MLPDKRLIVFILAWLMLAVIQVMALYQGKACNSWFPVVRGAIALTLELELIAIIVAGIVLLIKTITATKQQVYNNEANFRAAIGNILDCFGVYSAIRDRSGQIVDFHIEYVNTAACVSNGWSSEEQIGRRLCEILPKHKESGLFAQYCQVVETGQTLVKDELIYEDNFQTQPLTRVFNIRAAKFQDGFVVNWRDVTQHHRAEQAVIRQQQELATLVENIPDIVTRFDSQLRYIYANSIHEQITGLESAALTGKSLSEVWANEPQAPQWQAILQAAINTGQKQTTEFSFPTNEDSNRFYQMQIVPEFLPEGTVASVLTVTRDITDFKQTQAALQTHQQLIRTVLENFPNGGVFLFDQNLRYILAAGQGLAMVGMNKADLEGKTIWEALPPETYRSLESPYRHALVGRDSRFEAVYGNHIYDVHVLPVRNEHGQIFAGMAITQDITERKQVEAELRQKQERLNLAKLTAKIGTFEWNLQTNVNIWSKELEALYGLKPGEFSGTYEGWVRWIHPEDLAEVEASLASALETGEMFTDWRVIWPDGTVHWLQARAKVFYDDDGKPLRMVGINVDITAQQAALQEQSAAQAALAESEERLRLAMKAANQGLYDLNIQTGEAVVTPEYAQMLGYDPDEFKETNQAWRDRLHPDDRQLVYRLYKEYVAGKTEEYRVEFRQRSKSGDWLWILSIGKIVAWDEQGNPLRMLGTHTDITKRKQSELALQNALQLLNLHIDTTPLALVQWDCDLCVTRWSSAAEKIFGWLAEEVLGKHIQDLHMVYEEDVTVVAQVGDRLLSGQESQIINYNRNYTKDGKVIHCEWYNSTITDETGRVSSILSLVLDVTERTKAEKAIRQSELKFRTLADTMPQMVWITKPDGYHEYFNQRWYDYTGKTLEQTQGEGWQYILHPDDVERTFAIWQNSLQTGNSYNIEYRLRRGSDGEYRWHLGKALPLREQNGQIVKWFGSCTDIHDQKLLIEERAQALERERAARMELEKASRMKDEFLAIVSHELRSPLNGILGWSRLLRTRKLPPDKIEQALESIERNAQAQTQLIEDLLDISRIIRGNIRLNLRPTNLIPVILAALDTVRPVANSKSIQIDSQLTADVVVSGDPERLQQVVWNLLSNAVKFTPEGGRVEIHLEQVETNVQIQVIDTGKGISPEFLPYVFDRFRQADSTTTRNQGGLGLGLAIVRNLVELHNGKVAVTSPGEGKGATFTVELPILSTPLSITAEQLLIQRQTAWDTNVQITGLRILVVDDEPDTREFLQIALEQYGATVTAASSAREALQLLPVVKPDVILSDIGMPDEDGYSLIRKIRALPSEQGGNVPAAALTAYARQSDRQQALTAGFQIHIPKPIEPIQLLKVVASLAGRIS
ncbi:MAG TPA: PAS domain S-box protein [Leptolyngbyaceae cyanobacterium]